MKDKNGIITANAFQKRLDETNRNPNKIWVDKVSDIYNRSMKSWLEDNDIEIYSTHSEKRYVVAGRFVITLKKQNL